jgi:hypothetical protein
MTASQIDAGNFSVTTSSGATRAFTGNVGNAQDLARAFNNMISRTSEPPKPATT